MRAFEEDNLRRWVVKYLRTCYPERCAAYTSADFAVLVQNAIASLTFASGKLGPMNPDPTKGRTCRPTSSAER